MPREIERKFLVRKGAWSPRDAGTPYHQGYLVSGKGGVVRVRLAGEQGWLTIKSVTRGISRSEYEYSIPRADAVEMLDHLCEKPLIVKTRHTETHGGHTWVIDTFHGENEGLVVAEIELREEDEPFERPGWLGREVTTERKYSNSNLVKHPFREWD